jgi:tripartite-type tricarboxylate transporter receptor subunit TctC
MLGNEVSFMFDSISTSFQQVKAGKLKAIAVSSLSRAAILPKTPTVAETLPGFDVTVWYGILAPAGTPDAVIGKLSRAFAEVSADPKIRSQLADSGYAMIGSTPAVFGKHIETELTKWNKAVKDSGATIQ